jgi:hypothetical protein
MLMNDCEVETVVEKTTELKSPPLRWVAMEPASALLREAQTEAQKGP